MTINSTAYKPAAGYIYRCDTWGGTVCCVTSKDSVPRFFQTRRCCLAYNGFLNASHHTARVGIRF